jgi:hypothetical protein
LNPRRCTDQVTIFGTSLLFGTHDRICAYAVNGHHGVERGLKPQKTKALIHWFLPHCFLLSGVGIVLEARDQHSPHPFTVPWSCPNRHYGWEESGRKSISLVMLVTPSSSGNQLLRSPNLLHVSSNVRLEWAKLVVSGSSAHDPYVVKYRGFSSLHVGEAEPAIGCPLQNFAVECLLILG